MIRGRERASPAKGGRGVVMRLSTQAEIGVARTGKLLCGEEPPLRAARRALDQLGCGEGDGASGQGEGSALSHSLGRRLAVEESDGPEIELRVCHAACLSTLRRQRHPSLVMAGLVPAIHDFDSISPKTCMPGTRPGMTTFQGMRALKDLSSSAGAPCRQCRARAQAAPSCRGRRWGRPRPASDAAKYRPRIRAPEACP